MQVRGQEMYVLPKGEHCFDMLERGTVVSYICLWSALRGVGALRSEGEVVVVVVVV